MQAQPTDLVLVAWLFKAEVDALDLQLQVADNAKNSLGREHVGRVAGLGGKAAATTAVVN